MDDNISRTPPREMPDSAQVIEGSLHEIILADIREQILSGKWRPGHRIPIETDLALHYRCSRMTVNKVMTQLVSSGLIERRKRAGSFVLAPRAQSALLVLNEIKDDVLAMGRPYWFSVLKRKTRRSHARDMARLGVDDAVPVLAIQTLHFAGNSAYCHEDRLINLDAVPDAEPEQFKELPPGSWLIQHVPWTEAEHRIRAAMPDVEMANALGMGAHEACLVLERLTWRGGVPLTDVLLTYPAAMRELIARFTPS